MSPRTRRKATNGDRSDPIVTTAASSQADTVSAGHRPAAAVAATATTASPTTLPAESSGTGSTAKTPASLVKRSRTLPAEDRNRRSPVPHPVLRQPGRSRDRPEPLPTGRPREHLPYHRRPVAPAGQQPHRKKNMRRPAQGAPCPPRPDAYRGPPGRKDPPPDRVTPPAQPPTAARTPKQAVTEKLLHNGRAVAYREHWCLCAPSRPSPDFAKR